MKDAKEFLYSFKNEAIIGLRIGIAVGAFLLVVGGTQALINAITPSK